MRRSRWHAEVHRASNGMNGQTARYGQRRDAVRRARRAVRQRWPRLLAPTAAVVVSLMVAGCGSGSGGAGVGASADAPIKILAIVDTSGAGKAFGSQQVAGLQAAAAYFNGRGGISGHKVSVTVQNDNGDPSTALSLATKALSGGSDYTMVWPGSEGTVDAALIPVMARYHQYSIALTDGNSACAQASRCPNEFSLSGAASLPEIRAAEWFKSKGVTNVGVLAEQISFAQTETPAIKAALKSQGITVEEADFPSSAVSVTAELAKLKSEGAQAVFAEALGPAGGYTLNARNQLGWTAPVVFDLAAASLDITKLAPSSQLTNAYETGPYCADPAHAKQQLGLIKQHAPSGSWDGSVPCNLSGNGWDAVVVLKNAVAKAKSLDSQALTKATEQLAKAAQVDPLYAAYPRIGYSANNHEDVLQTPNDFDILPVGPINGTQIQQQ